MVRRQYKQPPVHEVIIDVSFEGPGLTDRQLGDVRGSLSEEWGTPARASTLEIKAQVTGYGQHLDGSSAFVGWEFTDYADTRWVLRTLRDKISLHMVRRDDWPGGDYAGWSELSSRYGRVLELVKESYAGLSPQRVGVRYINRIAIPEGSDFEQWFTLIPQRPDFVDGLHSFDIRHVWSDVEAHPNLSASIRLARIQAPADAAPGEASAYGVVLDIDVFNLWIRKAPGSFDEVLARIEESHSVENDLFEQCVTKELRATFGEES
jgi:uncharacterized protein (TIGR04255 family)